MSKWSTSGWSLLNMSEYIITLNIFLPFLSPLHWNQSCISFLISFQVLLFHFTSESWTLLHFSQGLPLLCCPCWFHCRAAFRMQLFGYLRVCPIHFLPSFPPHFFSFRGLICSTPKIFISDLVCQIDPNQSFFLEFSVKSLVISNLQFCGLPCSRPYETDFASDLKIIS